MIAASKFAFQDRSVGLARNNLMTQRAQVQILPPLQMSAAAIAAVDCFFQDLFEAVVYGVAARARLGGGLR